jgi:putative endonuclease
MERDSYVYILASRRNGTLYVGVTADLARRVYEHRTGAIAGFTRTYDVKHLVWYELHGDIGEAIAQEKRVKRWRRAWKIALIERFNPQWRDLYETLNQ